MARASLVLILVVLALMLVSGTALAANTDTASSDSVMAAPTPSAQATPQKGLSPEQRFANNYGSTRTFKDKDGNVKTLSTIPGIVTAISPTSVMITPNNPQSRGGPFSIDGTTVIKIGNRRGTTARIAVNDMVHITVLGEGTQAMAITKVAPAQLRPQGNTSWQNTLRNLLQRLPSARRSGT